MSLFGEFSNKLLQEMSIYLNLSVRTTPVKSPRSN